MMMKRLAMRGCDKEKVNEELDRKGVNDDAVETQGSNRLLSQTKLQMMTDHSCSR